jgi:hypothetical protein
MVAEIQSPDQRESAALRHCPSPFSDFAAAAFHGKESTFGVAVLNPAVD